LFTKILVKMDVYLQERAIRWKIKIKAQPHFRWRACIIIKI